MKTSLVLAMILASCGGAQDRCGNPPKTSVNAFFAGRDASRDVVATVATITPLADIGGFRYEMRDGSRLTWIAKEPIAGVVAGRTYRFVVDYAPGFPDASGMLVFENDRMIFAALTDQKLLDHVLKSGVPDFKIATGEAACSSRGRSKCHEALVNLPLAFEHAGERKVLLQGEKARVGEFEIDALVAQQVTYAPRCGDAGLPGVSFTIRRFSP